MQTLRDRVIGKVDIEATRSGPQSLFDEHEEAIFVEHLKSMASLGYGYTGPEVKAKASDYAVFLGKRQKGQPLSEKWYSGLKSRWPEIRTVTPRALAKERAQASSEQVVSDYFDNLHTVMTANDLIDKPECIYNFDEKGVLTEHRPPKVIAGAGPVPAVTSNRSAITTILSCGNALGTQIPPYFIFKGQRMSPELLSDSSHGASGTVTETGWSNSEVFLKYLNEHFLKYIQRPSADQPVLLIFDGHRSHVNIPVINWAKENNVVLFVLPAHTSHILQPLDVGCFGPLQRVYNSECHTFLRSCPESRITRYNVCKLACSAYTVGLSPCNLRSAFGKTGIFPFEPSVISKDALKPAQAYKPIDSKKNSQQLKPLGPPEDFFLADQQFIAKKIEYESQKQQKHTLSKIVSGKCITDPTVENKILKFTVEGVKKRPESKNKKQQSKKIKTKPSPPKSKEPQPGPSKETIPLSDSSDFSDEMEESDKCCVCHKFQPDELKNVVSLVFVKWAKCDYVGCDHWTHLMFCCKQRVVRHNDTFICPCHNNTEE